MRAGWRSLSGFYLFLSPEYLYGDIVNELYLQVNKPLKRLHGPQGPLRPRMRAF